MKHVTEALLSWCEFRQLLNDLFAVSTQRGYKLLIPKKEFKQFIINYAAYKKALKNRPQRGTQYQGDFADLHMALDTLDAAIPLAEQHEDDADTVVLLLDSLLLNLRWG